MTDDPFVAHRSLLFTVAYAMLGSAADAEDVVQEAWLRWVNVDQDAVRDPRAYAVTIVTRKALDRLRALTRQRSQECALISIKSLRLGKAQPQCPEHALVHAQGNKGPGHVPRRRRLDEWKALLKLGRRLKK